MTRRARAARRASAGDPPAGQAARAAHARARQLAVHRRVPLRVQGAGDGVLRGARVPARRRGALDRLERHGAHAAAVRQALHRGARADGDARRRPLGLGALRHARRASRASWRASWPRCSRCPPSATTTASALLLFTDRIEHVVPPRKGRRHALRAHARPARVRAGGHGHRHRRARSSTSGEMLRAQGDHLHRLRLPGAGPRAAAQAARAAARRRRRDGRGSERAGAARHRARALRRSGDGRDARRRHERSRACARSFAEAVRARSSARDGTCCAGSRSTRSRCTPTAASSSR